jgi:TRAP-type C4-dicarboxylate transport system permease small subunit
MRRLLDGLYTACLALAGVFLVSIFALMIGEAVMRKAGSYITGAGELIGWCCAAAGFLALPSVFARGEMVRVTYLVDALPPWPRKVLLLGCLLLAMVWGGYMTWAAGAYLYDGWRSEELTQGMILIPVWIPQLSLLVGAALLWVAMLDKFVTTWLQPADTLTAAPADPKVSLSQH